jgi:hypothetical protein
MGGNCLTSLGKIPMAGFRLEIRRYVFKRKKNNLLIVKKLNKQIKLY